MPHSENIFISLENHRIMLGGGDLEDHHWIPYN